MNSDDTVKPFVSRICNILHRHEQFSIRDLLCWMTAWPIEQILPLIPRLVRLIFFFPCSALYQISLLFDLQAVAFTLE